MSRNNLKIHLSIGKIQPGSENRNGSPVYTSSGACQHLSELRSRVGANPFINFRSCVKVRPLGRASIRREPPNELVRCGTCEHASPRLYACVTCAAVFCRLHAPSHPVGNASDPSLHSIAVDIDRAELFCCGCRDQLYDCDFDAAVVLAQTEATVIGSIEDPPPHPENTRKRRRVEYKPWTPDVKEQVSIVGSSSPVAESARQ